MDKKAIASLKKLVKNGRDLADIITKYLSVLESTIAAETAELAPKKVVEPKKEPAKKAPIAKKAIPAKVVPAIKKAVEAKAPTAVKKVEKKAAPKTEVKAVLPNAAAPVKKVVEKTEKPVVQEAAKVAKRGRPAKAKK